MPGFDGSGPMGAGPRTGRGLGNCGAGRTAGFGFGRGRGFGPGCYGGRGFRRGYAYDMRSNNLDGYKKYLEDELKAVNAEIKRDE